MVGDTDESGTEGETGRSHNRGKHERETENGSGASRTCGGNGVVGDFGSEFLALVQRTSSAPRFLLSVGIVDVLV